MYKTQFLKLDLHLPPFERGLILRVRMEKALVKVGSIKAGGFWLTKKAKEEINNITDDLNVSKFFFSISLLFLHFLFCLF